MAGAAEHEEALEEGGGFVRGELGGDLDGLALGLDLDGFEQGGEADEPGGHVRGAAIAGFFEELGDPSISQQSGKKLNLA